ncbi:DUF1680 family protein [Nakamurella sp. UYEF19]|uniref:glycoside hydrolase family 127 protein n=1 Tax=Nakamurella sp. UYEF19 TaxID=1756392 RepID=UPI003391A01D
MVVHPDSTLLAGGGPVAPTAGARVTLRPLPLRAVRIEGGLWAERQRINRDVSIPIGSRRLREAGNLADLEAAANGTTTAAGVEYQGPLFMDSDVYKWLEAVAWENGREPAEGLGAELETFTAAVQAAQQADGYLNSFVQVTRGGRERYRELAFSHEMYCYGHLIQAAVAGRRAGSDAGLWDVAIRVADHLVETFGPTGNTDIDGHPVIEMALVELYRECGDARYLDLAAHFVDARGHGLNRAYGREPIYFSDRVPARDSETVEGHAVRALYFAAGVADVIAEGKDPGRTLDAAQHRQWEHMVATKTYLTGGNGSRWDGEAFGDPYELPTDVAYCETCAAIGSVQWSWRRLLATGDVRYADLIERTLLNGFLSGVSQSGDEFFYVNALQVRADAVPDDHRQPATGRQGWFQTACCPPNVMRTISSIQTYLATTDDNGIQLHQYAAGTVSLDERRLSIRTEYPWQEAISVTVDATDAGRWALSLRIPAWCHGATIAMAGDEPAPVLSQVGYAVVEREWTAGDTVVLTLPMPARLTAGHHRVDAVRGARAIERGPLVYAVEQIDLPTDLAVDDLELASASAADLTAVPRPDLLGGIVTITGWGSTVDGATGEFTAVPYQVWANRGVGPMRVWIPLAQNLFQTLTPDAIR